MLNEQRIQFIERYCIGDKFSLRFKDLAEAIRKDRDVDVALAAFPTLELLTKVLIDKLEGKSVHKTYENIMTGKADRLTVLKFLYSLGTHAVIECQRNPEYEAVMHDVYAKIGKVLLEA